MFRLTGTISNIDIREGVSAKGREYRFLKVTVTTPHGDKVVDYSLAGGDPVLGQEVDWLVTVAAKTLNSGASVLNKSVRGDWLVSVPA